MQTQIAHKAQSLYLQYDYLTYNDWIDLFLQETDIMAEIQMNGPVQGNAKGCI